MSKKDDLTGKKYNRLLVIAESEPHYQPNGAKVLKWLCECECGNKIVCRGADVKNGHTKSCGCLQKEKARIKCVKMAKHNKKNTRLYRIWNGIKTRCLNPNNKAYKNYGGRGINVYSEWEEDFISFYDWAIKNGYKDNLTIDRINNDGDYKPNNCRWVTYKKQNNNRNNNHRLTVNGVTHTLSEWEDLLQLPKKSLSTNIKNNPNFIKDILKEGCDSHI